MSTSDATFEITHGVGDPREPDYQADGLPVCYALYRERDFVLSFRLVGTRIANTGKVALVVEAPADTREVLGRRWTHREVVFSRVTHFLEQLEPGKGWVPKGGYSVVRVDASKIPGWLPTKWKRIRLRLTPIFFSLPSRVTFPPLLLGYLLALLAGGEMNMYNVSPASISAGMVTMGVLAMLLQVREAHRDYRMFLFLSVATSWYRKNHSFRIAAAKQALRAFARRYVVTMMLGLFLVYLGLR